jgi:hypothetical protein
MAETVDYSIYLDQVREVEILYHLKTDELTASLPFRKRSCMAREKKSLPRETAVIFCMPS